SARQMEGEDSFAPLETLASSARELGIDHVDLREALAAVASRGGKAFLTPKDGHPSATGYAAAADAVAAELTRLGIAAGEEGVAR
ncbi:MAG TPA: hypothetical protein VFG76_04440, partial [Candidatus Polarisedimenticolia bacterium]|nr:hypothetical protein [Candidatus Polarisedimenticolia bacterium]